MTIFDIEYIKSLTPVFIGIGIAGLIIIIASIVVLVIVLK
jgi:hypothetical protein